jgi:UDP-2,3-diacylglucosamine pyrophosphatase LpxH
MKRFLLVVLTSALIVVTVALSRGQKTSHGQRHSSGELDITVEERNPWTHLRLNNQPDEFQFAVVSDRTGGHRARVFSRAVEQLNLLQPEFVLSVGDLIEGYTEDPKQLDAEWRQFQRYVGKLHMPFFYVPGNHDISNRFMRTQWRERFGRQYYHFTYRNVLFLLLNSDDGQGNYIGREQIAYVQKALEMNSAVRWTIVAMHKPLWTRADLSRNGWLQIERLLNGRPYTVLVGHEHQYQKFVRHGQNYYQLATTGGVSRMRGVRYGEFDHLVWVTLKKDGPLLANIMLDGVYSENLEQVNSDEDGSHYASRGPVHPVRGKVFHDGCPTPNAIVRFSVAAAKNREAEDIADAYVDHDGTFTLSTYAANDGAPAGHYVVTVACPDPRVDAFGKPGPNRLPQRYSRPETSPLRAQVKTGTNEFTFHLKK